jgi:hypothetical protein
MSATTETIPQIIATIDYLDTCIETATATVKALKDQESKARHDLADLMDRDGVSSYTDQATGRNVHFRTIRQHVIADPDLVRVSLQEIGELESCLKLDPAAVKKVLKQHPRLAGMEEQVTQSLVVGPKPDAVVAPQTGY